MCRPQRPDLRHLVEMSVGSHHKSNDLLPMSRRVADPLHRRIPLAQGHGRLGRRFASSRNQPHLATTGRENEPFRVERRRQLLNVRAENQTVLNPPSAVGALGKRKQFAETCGWIFIDHARQPVTQDRSVSSPDAYE